MKNYGSLIIQASDYTIREETLQGRPQLVVPVIMMVEGVHNGSAGALFHSSYELSRCIPSWDGIPISIQHPQADGEFVSCNSPGVIDAQVVGKVFSTSFISNQLRAEAWLDRERLREISPEMLDSILQIRPIEVSVGVFTDDEVAVGRWNGESYTAIARNHNPDHLALLIGSVGACSIKDGCGIRANEREGGEEDMKRGKQSEPNAVSAKYLEVVGYHPLVVCEEGYRDRIAKIQTKLDNMDDDLKVHFLTEVYDGHFIYAVHPKSGSGGDGSYYRRQYQLNADGSIEFLGESTAVVKKVEYVVQTADEGKSETEGGGKTMGENVKKDEVKCKGCPDVVKALIAHPLTAYVAEDAEVLLALGEDLGKDFLTKMVPQGSKEVVTEENSPAKAITQAIEVLKESFKDSDTFLDLLPPAQREVMESGMRLHKERRVHLIAHIAAYQKDDAFKAEELDKMGVPELEQVAKAIGMPVNYSIQPAGGEGAIPSSVPEGRAPAHLIKAHEAEEARAKENLRKEGGEK